MPASMTVDAMLTSYRISTSKPEPADSADEFLRSVGVGATIATYRPGAVIFSQGDASDSVMYLHEGAAMLSVSSSSGKQAVFALLEPGDFFGECALAGGFARPHAATAITAATVLIIPTRHMTCLLHTRPTFSNRFITRMLARNIRMEEDLVDQRLNSSEKRLARALLRLTHFGEVGRVRCVLPRISQETLAQMIGTTRSRVSFFMNKFKKLGFIEYRGGLTIHNSLVTVISHDERVEAA